MKKIITLLALAFCINYIFTMDSEQILQKVDENETFKTMKYSGTMIIKKESRRRPRTKTFDVIAKGTDKGYIVFTNPGDRGTKYLKLDDEMWVKGTYAERADKISGHKLREGMMGSDFSYEDSLENDKLSDQYKPELLDEETVGDSECYKLLLTAKIKDISYIKQIMWIDKNIFVPLKIQYFALSDELLKEMTILRIEKIKNRFLATKIKMVNKQRKDSYTIFEMNDIVVDDTVDDSIFSKQQLER